MHTKDSKLLYSLGTFGFMFLFGGFYSQVYFHGTAPLPVALFLFIGASLLVIQYYPLRNIPITKRLPEILIILVVNLIVFFLLSNVPLAGILNVAAAIFCIMLNRKHIQHALILNKN